MTNAQRIRINKIMQPLMIVATLLVIFGVLAVYHPELLIPFLPSSLMGYVTQYNWLAMTPLIIGMTFHVLAILLISDKPQNRCSTATS